MLGLYALYQGGLSLRKGLLFGAGLLVATGFYIRAGFPDMMDCNAALLNDSRKNILIEKTQELITYLGNHPRNCQGWALLAQSYETLGYKTEMDHVRAHYKQSCISTAWRLLAK